MLKKRLPFYCDRTITNIFGVDLSFYVFNSTNMTYSLILKDIFFFYYKTQNRYLLNAINFFIYSRLKANLLELYEDLLLDEHRVCCLLYRYRPLYHYDITSLLYMYLIH